MTDATIGMCLATLAVLTSATCARAADAPVSLRLTLADVAPACQAAPQDADGVPKPAEEMPNYGITGNWNGARDALANRGIFASGYVALDIAKALRAGLNTRDWSTSYLLDLNILADMEKAAHLPGGTAFLDFQSHDQSRNGDVLVGDIQTYDNITAPRFVQISQLWYRQEIGDDLRIKIGKIDANSDAAKPGDDATDAFSLIEHGLDFIHSVPGHSGTLHASNVYPAFAPGVEAFYGHNVYAGLGAFYANDNRTFLNFAGNPNRVLAPAGGTFLIGEVGSRWTSVGDTDDRPGHAAVGAWYHTGEFPRNDGSGSKHGASGAYFVLDQSLFRSEKDGEPTRDLAIFLTGGWTDKATAPMDQNLALGINAAGFVPGRPDDSLGVMASWVHLPAQPGLLHPFEMTLETYYKFQLAPWAFIKPDFQYIFNPSGTLPNAAVATVRVVISF